MSLWTMSYLVLEFGWIAPVYWNRCTIDMQLSYNTAATLCPFLLYQLRPESAFI